MRLPFVEIPTTGVRFDIEDVSWFPDSEVARQGRLDASVFLQRNENRVTVTGTIAVTFVFACDRCLESFVAPRQIEFSLEVELVEAGGQAMPGVEHVCSPDEMDVVYVDVPVVDLHNVLRQQIFLALPLKKLCSDDCRGLCSQCGANLNLEACGCARGNHQSPFAVLRGLKKE